MAFSATMHSFLVYQEFHFVYSRLFIYLFILVFVVSCLLDFVLSSARLVLFLTSFSEVIRSCYLFIIQWFVLLYGLLIWSCVFLPSVCFIFRFCCFTPRRFSSGTKILNSSFISSHTFVFCQHFSLRWDIYLYWLQENLFRFMKFRE